jgi:energy-coupling factor transporter ATP-binding protein EcfA2
MRLERLEINGFKSFSDRSELAFDKGVTAIVGPNGCGKSNVADAITWVMGEQSAKSLRGDKMEDVIFSGSDARKPTATAEVRLKFSGFLKTISAPVFSTPGNGHANGHAGVNGDANGHAGANGHGASDSHANGNSHGTVRPAAAFTKPTATTETATTATVMARSSRSLVIRNSWRSRRERSKKLSSRWPGRSRSPGGSIDRVKANI